MVYLLPMDRAAHMLIQRPQSREAFLAKKAAEPIPIPSSAGGERAWIVIVLVTLPAKLLLGKEVGGINLAAVLIDPLTIHAGRAGTALKVVADACIVYELVGAPRAFDVPAHVNGGSEMLIQVVNALELALASVAVGHIVLLVSVVLKGLLRCEDTVALNAVQPMLFLLVLEP